MARGRSVEGAEPRPVSTWPYSLDDDTTESTTLLSNGTEEASGAGANGNGNGRKSSWSGFDDFEGLPWWRTPSVCSFPCAGKLYHRCTTATDADTDAGILAAVSLCRLHFGLWRCHCPQA